jgi:hypothetical protein
MNTLTEGHVTGAMIKKIHQLPPSVQHELSEYIEFLLQKYRGDASKRPSFGCMKGTVTWMSDDFNAPLEEFKDYM